MNHAKWQIKFADQHKAVGSLEVDFDPEGTPNITKKLLALDEQ